MWVPFYVLIEYLDVFYTVWIGLFFSLLLRVFSGTMSEPCWDHFKIVSKSCCYHFKISSGPHRDYVGTMVGPGGCHIFRLPLNMYGALSKSFADHFDTVFGQFRSLSGVIPESSMDNFGIVLIILKSILNHLEHLDHLKNLSYCSPGRPQRLHKNDGKGFHANVSR